VLLDTRHAHNLRDHHLRVNLERQSRRRKVDRPVLPIERFVEAGAVANGARPLLRLSSPFAGARPVDAHGAVSLADEA
jgi:hypothetical protein